MIKETNEIRHSGLNTEEKLHYINQYTPHDRTAFFIAPEWLAGKTTCVVPDIIDQTKYTILFSTHAAHDPVHPS